MNHKQYISVNSLLFYVTDGEFLREKILRHVKPGGEIGVIVPGFYREYTDGIPEDLKPHWSDQLDKWHTLDCMIYKKSAMIVNAYEEPFNVIAGDNITFIRIIAKRKEG